MFKILLSGIIALALTINAIYITKKYMNDSDSQKKVSACELNRDSKGE